MQTIPNKESLAKLLPDGEVKRMAEATGVSQAAVSKALKRARPGNRFVVEALKKAKECGSLEAAQALASITG